MLQVGKHYAIAVPWYDEAISLPGGGTTFGGISVTGGTLIRYMGYKHPNPDSLGNYYYEWDHALIIVKATSNKVEVSGGAFGSNFTYCQLD